MGSRRRSVGYARRHPRFVMMLAVLDEGELSVQCTKCSDSKTSMRAPRRLSLSVKVRKVSDGDCFRRPERLPRLKEPVPPSEARVMGDDITGCFAQTPLVEMQRPSVLDVAWYGSLFQDESIAGA